MVSSFSSSEIGHFEYTVIIMYSQITVWQSLYKPNVHIIFCSLHELHVQWLISKSNMIINNA